MHSHRRAEQAQGRLGEIVLTLTPTKTARLLAGPFVDLKIRGRDYFLSFSSSAMNGFAPPG
jgi:hypothetical protein